MNSNENELYHYGILGQKWGVRRYQNPDGSLTAAGRKRYSKFVGGDKKKLSTIELASIGAARQHLESMNPQSRNKYLQKKNSAGLEKITREAARTLSGRFDTEKELANLERVQKEHQTLLNDYQAKRRKAIDELYADDSQFKQVARQYAEKVAKDEQVTDPREKEHLIDHFVNGDGFQDDAENWYINKVRGIDNSKLVKLSKEYKDAIEDYANKIIDQSGDLNVRAAALEATGNLKGMGIVGSVALLNSDSDERIRGAAKLAVETAIREYGAHSIYEDMRDYMLY